MKTETMNHIIRRTRAEFRRSPIAWWLLVFALGNAAVLGLDWLVEFRGTRVVLAALALIAVVVAIIKFVSVVRGGTITVRPIEDPRQGLIVLASVQRYEDSGARAAIRYHYRGELDERPEPRLKYLWIIHSKQFEKEPAPPGLLSSFRHALALEEEYKPLLRAMGGDVFRHPVENPDDPWEVWKEADTAYKRARRLKLAIPNDVIADITGGTKSMTLGLAYAWLPRERHIEFMKPRGYLEDGRADAKLGSVPLQINDSYLYEEYDEASSRSTEARR